MSKEKPTTGERLAVIEERSKVSIKAREEMAVDIKESREEQRQNNLSTITAMNDISNSVGSLHTKLDIHITDQNIVRNGSKTNKQKITIGAVVTVIKKSPSSTTFLFLIILSISKLIKHSSRWIVKLKIG